MTSTADALSHGELAEMAFAALEQPVCIRTRSICRSEGAGGSSTMRAVVGPMCGAGLEWIGGLYYSTDSRRQAGFARSGGRHPGSNEGLGSSKTVRTYLRGD